MTGSVSLAELAELLEGRLEGDPGHRIRSIRARDAVGAGEIAVIAREWDHPERPLPPGAAIVLADGLDLPADHRIFVGDPRRAFRRLLDFFHPPRTAPPGIEEGARIDPGARVDPSAWVASGARVGEGARIGAGARLHPGVVVGEGCEVGPGCELFPHVVLYPGTRLGARVRVHAGTVLGADGFGYHLESGRWTPVPQVGRLIVEDDVEIGANCALDRATLEATVVGRGSKLDNLVQVAHNVEIGPDSCLAAQVGVSGSVRMGAGCVLGGQAGVADHARIAPGTQISAQAGVVDRAGPGEWGGTPAIPMDRARRAYLLLPEIPGMLRELRRLRREVEELRRRLEDEET